MCYKLALPAIVALWAWDAVALSAFAQVGAPPPPEKFVPDIR